MANQYLYQQCTHSGNAVLTSTYHDDCIVAGDGYIIEYTFNLASNATIYVEVNPTAMVDKRLTVFPTDWGMSASYALVTLGVCSSCSGGTAVTFLNRNYYFASSNPAATLCNVNATPTDPVDSPIRFVVGTATQGVNIGGGTYHSGGMQILDPTLDYYFKVVNQTNVAAIVTMNIQIYETSSKSCGF
jgi:uncharacterized FAD-dependent dehydrogenase